MALMRSKLHLTDKELMDKSWIALNLEMADFPYYDHNAKKMIRDKDKANEILSKYMSHE